MQSAQANQGRHFPVLWKKNIASLFFTKSHLIIKCRPWLACAVCLSVIITMWCLARVINTRIHDQNFLNSSHCVNNLKTNTSNSEMKCHFLWNRSLAFATLKATPFKLTILEVPNDHVLTQMANMAPFFESIKRKSAGPMLPETKRLLVELYRPYNEQLAAFLGDERFAWRDASFATA